MISDTISMDSDRDVVPQERTRKLYTLEPAVLLLFFALNLSGAVFQNQIIYQTCSTVFNYSESQCAALGTAQVDQITEEIETQVQPYAARIFMARSLFKSIIPAIGSLFIGPWSDKFGRKPIILAAFLGYCSLYMISSVIAFFSTKFIVNPWFYILAIVPVSITGGNCALITGVLCFITDICHNKDRAYRMVLIEASVYVGLMAGSLLSSFVLAATNCAVVFLISGILVLLTVFYIALFLEESLKPEQIERGSRIRGLFRWHLVKDMFRACFERRPNYDRMIIWLVMLTLGISIFTMEGASTVFFLFVREKFEWTVKDYTFYDAASIIVQIFGNVIGVYFLQKIIGLSTVSLALLAYGSCVIDSVIKATAIYPWHLYLAIGVSLLKGIAGPMCRAILSHVVSGSDVGKVYSLTTSIESISPLGSAPLYTYVYSLTITTYPGAFNFITIGMYFICYIFLTIVFGLQKVFPNTIYEAIGN